MPDIVFKPLNAKLDATLVRKTIQFFHFRKSNQKEPMNPFSPKDEGIKQFKAGASLIVSTHLLQWDSKGKFKACESSNDFEKQWTKFNPTFGRAAMWNIFSTGAELLLKGVLLANGQLNLETKKVLNYPKNAYDVEKIGRECFLETKKDNCDLIDAMQFGNLNNAITEFRRWKGMSSPYNMDSSPAAFVITTYEILRDTIRNRDTHAYVENVRESHYHLINEIFLQTFNTCLTYMGAAQAEISNQVLRDNPNLH